ncbi:MAG: GAF domain-containing protein, partial [Nitrospirae bacterium]|nr:GAF domain-containing protein [Nitrospirota bacterium]
MSVIWLFPALASTLVSAVVCGAILLMRSYGGVERSILAVLALLSWTQLCNIFRVLWAEHHYFWEHITLVGEILLPVALFKTGVSFIGETGTQGSAFITAMWRFRALLVMGCICAGVVGWSMLGGGNVGAPFGHEGYSFPYGKALAVFILLSLVFALAQFEQVLRYSRDPLRFQIKFVLLGLGGIAGFSILQSTQPISLGESGHEFVFVSGLATLLSVGLLTFGLRRWKKEHRKDVVHLSPQALYTSLTFLIVGGYFILIGGLGELVRLTGWNMSEAFAMLLVFVGVMALMVVAFSRQAKAELRLFVARHFFKSKYDYRHQWIDMIESFRSCQTVDSILDMLLELLGRTFGADRVTVWLAFDADGSFHQVRSVNSVRPPRPLTETHPLVLELQGRGEILEVAEVIQKENPEWQQFVLATHAVICAPFQTPDSLLGFVTLSHELRNQSYRQDDFDLLRSMTHHVTMLLHQANLMEERTAAARWEAMSRFSTFCLHDLKTLTAALSMVAQNAQTHGKDPVFQESAMRTVTNTVKKMTDLITKISVRSHSPSMDVAKRHKQVNINSLVLEAVQSLSNSV